MLREGYLSRAAGDVGRGSVRAGVFPNTSAQ